MAESPVLTFKRARTPHYDDPAAVGARVREARLAAHLSQRELSFPGCSSAYISRIERGERIPSLQVMREIARRTGVSEQVLAFGVDVIDAGVSRRIRAVEAAEAGGEQGRTAERLPGAFSGCIEGRPGDRAVAGHSIPRTIDAEVVVVGAGIMGVATARALAQAGRRVVLLEQFELGHARGSSHGGSRIFRLTYPEQHYVRLAQGAHQAWSELEAECRRAADRADGRSHLRCSRSRDARGLSPRAASATSSSREQRQKHDGRSTPARPRTCCTSRTAGRRSPTGPMRHCSGRQSRPGRPCSTIAR